MRNLLRHFFLLLVLSHTSAFALENSSDFTKADRDFNESIDSIKLKFQSPLENIDENLNSYNELISLFEKFEIDNSNQGKRFLEKVKRGDPLSGDELIILRKSIDTYYKINLKITSFAKTYNIDSYEMGAHFAKVQDNLSYVKAHYIYLSGYILALDQMTRVYDLYFKENGLFRRIVKNSLKDKKTNNKAMNDLIKLTESAGDVGNSHRFRSQILLLRNINDTLKPLLEADEKLLRLNNILITNPTSLKIAHNEIDFDVNYHSVVDTFVDGFNKMTNLLSGIFGNIAGSIRWRKGFMFQNEEIAAKMREKLKPMDILLEKSPFSLTDKFIPGHFGHVAIYLGTKEQLQEIQMWNHPQIIPFQEDIERGKVILEAVRPGVHLASLDEFSNIDEYTISRKSDGLSNNELIIEEITRGMDQIGKDYDFNFDVETLDKIVCSELIYIVFGQVHWPTKYRLGRSTITPDDVAEVLFQKNTKYDFADYVTSVERGVFKSGNPDELANDLSFEKRSEDGSSIKDVTDPKNSYWKRTEKCYSVSNDEGQHGMECKNSYTLEYYEERALAN